MRCVTADIVDEYGSAVESCEVQFRQFGGRAAFFGPIRTIRTLEDNATIKEVLQRRGDGAVLVVDGGGSLRTALVGDRIAATALQNGWRGLILFGAIRDVTALRELNLGIKALGSNPVKSAKLGTGSIDVEVTFGGVTFRQGDWVYSDETVSLCQQARSVKHRMKEIRQSLQISSSLS